MRPVSSLVKASFATLLSLALEHCSSPNPYLFPRDVSASSEAAFVPTVLADVAPFVPLPDDASVDAGDVVDATAPAPAFMAVDPRTETVFVSQERSVSSRLWAVDLAPRRVRPLASSPRFIPWQMAFLDGYVVLAETALIAYRSDSLQEERRWARQFNATSIEMLASPSGHQLAVIERSLAGTSVERSWLRVLDPSGSSSTEVNTTSPSLFAWMPDAEQIVQIMLDLRDGSAPVNSRLRIWDFTVPTATPAPSVELMLPDLGPPREARIAMRADGRQIAFFSPSNGLRFIDLPGGAVHAVGDLRVALGYSADGRRYFGLSYPDAALLSQLRVIDSGNFTHVDQALPTAAAYDVALTASGDRVVVSADRGGQDLAVLNTAQRTAASASGLRARLDHAITRGASELWWADRGLYRLNAGRIEPVPLGWMPSAVGLLPRQGALVLDVPGQRRLVMLDPSTLRPVADAAYP